MPFPLIRDLPSVIDTEGWGWNQLGRSGGDIWIGTDLAGKQWLLKLRGSFYAYREIVFARIAQTLGWSHQSSVFALVSEDAVPRQDSRELEMVQAVSWFLPEHWSKSCRPGCPLEALNQNFGNNPNDPIAALCRSSIVRVLDWARGDIAAHIFGANEGPQRLFTIGHEFVLIDSEQMFSTQPCELTTTGWWSRRDGSPSDVGIDLTLEVCKEVGALSNADLDACLSIPMGLEVDASWDIQDIVFAGRDYARKMSVNCC